MKTIALTIAIGALAATTAQANENTNDSGPVANATDADAGLLDDLAELEDAIGEVGDAIGEVDDAIDAVGEAIDNAGGGLMDVANCLVDANAEGGPCIAAEKDGSKYCTTECADALVACGTDNEDVAASIKAQKDACDAAAKEIEAARDAVNEEHECLIHYVNACTDHTLEDVAGMEKMKAEDWNPVLDNCKACMPVLDSATCVEYFAVTKDDPDSLAGSIPEIKQMCEHGGEEAAKAADCVAQASVNCLTNGELDISKCGPCMDGVKACSPEEQKHYAEHLGPITEVCALANSNPECTAVCAPPSGDPCSEACRAAMADDLLSCGLNVEKLAFEGMSADVYCGVTEECYKTCIDPAGRDADDDDDEHDGDDESFPHFLPAEMICKADCFGDGKCAAGVAALGKQEMMGLEVGAAATKCCADTDNFDTCVKKEGFPCTIDKTGKSSCDDSMMAGFISKAETFKKDQKAAKDKRHAGAVQADDDKKNAAAKKEAEAAIAKTNEEKEAKSDKTVTRFTPVNPTQAPSSPASWFDFQSIVGVVMAAAVAAMA